LRFTIDCQMEGFGGAKEVDIRRIEGISDG